MASKVPSRRAISSLLSGDTSTLAFFLQFLSLKRNRLVQIFSWVLFKRNFRGTSASSMVKILSAACWKCSLQLLF